jgi:hypothetical protein
VNADRIFIINVAHQISQLNTFFHFVSISEEFSPNLHQQPRGNARRKEESFKFPKI